MSCSQLIPVAIGLVSGNYIVQAFGQMDWAVAAERSWFQITALIAVWLIDYVTPQRRGSR